MSFQDEPDEHEFSYDCTCESCREYFIDLEADRVYEEASDR